jgi:hypothetical protein
MGDNLDQEIEAIKTLIKVLEPLSLDVRQNVLDYATKRLKVKPAPEIHTLTGELIDPEKRITIKEFKEKKSPQSANEMAALVAFYLSHIAPENERKKTINTKDLETYFKIGGYKLPRKIAFTLINAKKSGYLNSAEKGEYKLNPVGYNLVAHSMPRQEEVIAGRSKKGKAKRQTPKRKAVKNVKKKR